jgi:hypothetical protein
VVILLVLKKEIIKMKGKHFLGLVLTAIVITVVLPLVLLTYVASQAEEIRYPVPAYEGKELEEVRQWEKAWVGKKIYPTNVDQVKEFVPESLYKLMRDPETWGESWFEIVPYRQIKPTKGDIAFTIKYAGTCSIGPNEELLDYISGIPFPNPKTGLEIAHNFCNLNQGDTMRALQDIVIIDGKARYDRKMGMETHVLHFSARREIPPVPELPNPKGIYRAAHSSYYEPASMRGTRSLSIKWKDRIKPYESYSFSSTTRKIVRRSTAQRQDTMGGSDTTSDDNMVYDYAISAMNYKYLGRKEILLPRHQDAGQFEKGHREGYCLTKGFQRERIKTYVLECIHKNPNYLYSRQIWYVDPETWWIMYADKYDRRGRLWRIFDNGGGVLKSAYNDELLGTPLIMSVIDVQRLHGTGGGTTVTIGETGEYHQPEYYTPKALEKYGY